MSNPFYRLQGTGGRSGADNVKITKSELRFGPISITRVNTVPDMGTGRPGDVVLIDDTDNPKYRHLNDIPIPTSIGMWMKQPLSYSTSLQGNVVIGFPAGFANAGDVLEINNTAVTLLAPYTVNTIVDQIHTAGIPNIAAYMLGEAIAVVNTSGGAINIINLAGTPTDTTGLYSHGSLSEIMPNGIWMPIQDVAASGTPSAPTAASYITLFGDPSLPNARSIQVDNGLSMIDGGAGTDITIAPDIPSLPVPTESAALNDILMVYNTSLGKHEKIDISALPLPSISSTIQQAANSVGVATTTSVGNILPPNSVVKRVLISVDIPYPVGATLTIGKVGSTSILATAPMSDLQTVGIYEISLATVFATATQVIATINGTPGFGNSRILIDYAPA